MIRRFLLAVMLVLTLKGQGCETTTPDFAPQETDVRDRERLLVTAAATLATDDPAHPSGLHPRVVPHGTGV